MRLPIQRKPIKFLPDSSRVVARFFDNGEKRTINLINRILSLSPQETKIELDHTLMEFTGRHRNVSEIFMRHFMNHVNLLIHKGYNLKDISYIQKLLIGSYSTIEYSVESAAFFNPSIVEDFDQSYLEAGEKRIKKPT